MKNKDFTKTIVVHISSKEAFERISHVSEWWTANFEGNASKLNDVFTVHFGETFVTFKINEIDLGKKIVWLVTDCNLHWLTDKKEWQNTKIVWEVSTENNQTQINMTHVGLVPGIQCYNDCEKGWNFYVGESLFKLITEDKGLPETPKSSR